MVYSMCSGDITGLLSFQHLGINVQMGQVGCQVNYCDQLIWNTVVVINMVLSFTRRPLTASKIGFHITLHVSNWDFTGFHVFLAPFSAR